MLEALPGEQLVVAGDHFLRVPGDAATAAKVRTTALSLTPFHDIPGPPTVHVPIHGPAKSAN
jgi:hypothetical protein